MTTTYSAIGPWSNTPVPDIEVKVDPVDLTPVVQGLARLEVLLANLAPEITVPVPSVTIEQAPQERPVVHVHVPESVINITVPEAVVAAPHLTVEPPHVEVIVSLPGLKTLLVANAIVLVLTLLTVGFVAVRCFVYID